MGDAALREIAHGNRDGIARKPFVRGAARGHLFLERVLPLPDQVPERDHALGLVHERDRAQPVVDEERERERVHVARGRAPLGIVLFVELKAAIEDAGRQFRRVGRLDLDVAERRRGRVEARAAGQFSHGPEARGVERVDDQVLAVRVIVKDVDAVRRAKAAAGLDQREQVSPEFFGGR